MNDITSEISDVKASIAPIEESKTIDCQVFEYYQVGEGKHFEDHMFSIKIHVEDINYIVDRSYVDFVDLDRRLRKRFPNNRFQPIPLGAAKYLEKVLRQREKESKYKKAESGSASTGRDSSSSMMLEFQGSSSTPIPDGEQGSGSKLYLKDYSAIVEELDFVLVTLLSQPEIVSSDEMMLFLDEEASSMQADLQSLVPLSEYDILLLNTPVNKCMVSKYEEFKFHVSLGQFVLWKFSTVDYDIGFSVELNGDPKVPYARYKSHEKVITGTLEISQSAICTLKWDNSYALFRRKNLLWSARVVKPDEYRIAKQQALEIKREKRKFEDQRHALQRCAFHQVSLFNGVILNSTIASEHDQEERNYIRDIEEELLQLRVVVYENKSKIDNHAKEKEELEKQLIMSRENCLKFQELFDIMKNQLSTCEEELATTKSDLVKNITRKDELKGLNRKLAEEVINLQDKLKLSSEKESELMETCKSLVDQSEIDKQDLQMKHIAEISALKSKFEVEMNALKEEYEGQINVLMDTIDSKLDG